MSEVDDDLFCPGVDRRDDGFYPMQDPDPQWEAHVAELERIAEGETGEKPKRVRYPSCAKIERENPGKAIASISVAPDGTRTFTFGKAEDAAKEANAVEAPPSRSLFKARLVPKQKVTL